MIRYNKKGTGLFSFFQPVVLDLRPKSLMFRYSVQSVAIFETDNVHVHVVMTALATLYRSSRQQAVCI